VERGICPIATLYVA